MRAAYLVVADEAYGRQIPYAFLERMKDEFQQGWAEQSVAASAHGLNSSFRRAATKTLTA